MPKQSRSHQEFLEKMNEWNPMKDDYTNSQFNQYSSGPGASLDPELQPSELAKLSKNHQHSANNNKNHGGGNKAIGGPVPYLVFKYLPKDMSKKALQNICSSYGKVTSVRDSNKNDHFFVDCGSIADMEAIYRELENNTYGFKLFIGKQVKEKQQNSTALEESKKLPTRALKSENGIDLESRNYLPSSKQHPRPHIKQKPIVSCSDYNSSTNFLQQNDPQRHFLIEDDAHRLERAGLMKPNVELQTNSKYKYHNGSSYIEMPESTKKSIAEKSKQSVGHFDASSESYKNIDNVENKQPKSGPCLQCKKTCDSVCARCSQYFCSVQCQRNGWSTHRYICGKPEHLRKTQKKLTDIEQLPAKQLLQATQELQTTLQLSKVQTLTTSSSISVNVNPFSSITSTSSKAINPKLPPSGSLVTIITITKTNVVFIRSKSSEDNLLFFQIVSAIQIDGKNLKPLRKLPKCGQIVVTMYKSLYSRAMILDTEDLNNIKLIHMDHGVLDNKLFDELFDAPLYYCDLPRLVIPVILKDVPDVYMTDEIRTFMYSYLNGIDLYLKYESTDLNEDRGAYMVELLDEATNQSFNKIISNLAKPVEPVSSLEIIHRNFLKHQLLPKGENVQLVVMDNSLLCTGCISCTTIEYALEIQKFQNELQTYANSLPQQSYAPRVDELCVAKYPVDQKWYRGRCLELVGDGNPTIVFFDYGNISMVNITDIRRYPPQFTYPIFTSDCEIKGLPEHCDTDMVSKLEQLIPNGSIIKCDSVEVYEEDFFHVIKVNKITKALVAAGLLDLQSLRN